MTKTQVKSNKPDYQKIAEKIESELKKRKLFDKELPTQVQEQYKVFLFKINNKPIVCIVLRNIPEIVLQYEITIAPQHEMVLQKKGPKTIRKLVKEIFRISGENTYLPEIQLRKNFADPKTKSKIVLRKHLSFYKFSKFNFIEQSVKIMMNAVYLIEYFIQDILDVQIDPNAMKSYGPSPNFYA